WSFGVWVSRPHYRYLCLHFRFHTLHGTSQARFNAEWNAPLPLTVNSSVVCLCPIIIHAEPLDQ
ncbi:unnamed protein product, partial [Ectocarpus sp. 4 AP-2014]